MGETPPPTNPVAQFVLGERARSLTGAGRVGRDQSGLSRKRAPHPDSCARKFGPPEAACASAWERDSLVIFRWEWCHCAHGGVLGGYVGHLGLPRRWGFPVLSPRRLADPSGQGWCESSASLAVAPTCLSPRCAELSTPPRNQPGGRRAQPRAHAEGRPGFRDVDSVAGPSREEAVQYCGSLPRRIPCPGQSACADEVLGRAGQKRHARCVSRSHRTWPFEPAMALATPARKGFLPPSFVSRLRGMPSTAAAPYLVPASPVLTPSATS